VSITLLPNTSDRSYFSANPDLTTIERPPLERDYLFREWLYAHVIAEVEAQKRIDYYTPEEIEAWMAANP